jgi:hypothetical protein
MEGIVMLNKIISISALMVSLVLWFVLVLFGFLSLVLMLIFSKDQPGDDDHELPGKDSSIRGRVDEYGIDRRLKDVAVTSVRVNAMNEHIVR